MATPTCAPNDTTQSQHPLLYPTVNTTQDSSISTNDTQKSQLYPPVDTAADGLPKYDPVEALLPPMHLFSLNPASGGGDFAPPESFLKGSTEPIPQEPMPSAAQQINTATKLSVTRTGGHQNSSGQISVQCENSSQVHQNRTVAQMGIQQTQVHHQNGTVAQMEIQQTQHQQINEANQRIVGERSYTVFVNKISGVSMAATSMSPGKVQPFRCYAISLLFIEECFGDVTQPWNREYPAAQRIFGTGTRSAVVRKTLQTEHKKLYSPKRGLDKGVLKTTNDFLNLIRYGRVGEKLSFYTYAITDGVWRFSPTGRNLLKDMMSKHAMHGNLRPELTYAGEFHVQLNPETGRYILVIDNNSGTFAPNKNYLPNLQKLFEMNFPELEVVALDFQDPRLKEYTDKLSKIRYQ